MSEAFEILAEMDVELCSKRGGFDSDERLLKWKEDLMEIKEVTASLMEEGFDFSEETFRGLGHWICRVRVFIANWKEEGTPVEVTNALNDAQRAFGDEMFQGHS